MKRQRTLQKSAIFAFIFLNTGCYSIRDGSALLNGGTSIGGQSPASGAPGGAATQPPSQPSTPVTAPPATLPTPGTLELTSAPNMSGVQLIANRDSVIVRVPPIAGAKDYRVIVTTTNSAIGAGAGGSEVVTAANIYCAGNKPRNGNGSQVLVYDQSRQTVSRWYDAYPKSSRSLITIQPEVVREIEVLGLKGAVSAIVEAVSEPCPFPGVLGTKHRDVVVDNDEANLVTRGISSLGWNLDKTTHPIVTESEIRERYQGNMIYNGQGHPLDLQPGSPAPAMIHPVVLARAQVTLAPNTTGSVPTLFFDDFSNENDPLVRSTKYTPDNLGVRATLAKPLLFTNSKWNIYAKAYDYGAGYEGVDVFMKDGVLRTVLADWKQDVMSSIEAFPKQTVHINGDSYLYVRVEVTSNATDRRYPLFGLYGPSNGDSVFKTGPDGTPVLSREIMHTAFFYQDQGANPSLGGWNALQLFGRDGNPDSGNSGVTTPVYAPNSTQQVQFYQANPDSDMMVLVNQQLTQLPEPLVDNFQTTGTRSVIHVSPKDQTGQGGNNDTWYYQINAQGRPVSPMMDDQMLVGTRTKYEFYIRNNRVVMYVNGAQRLCNDFNQAPARLTMTEGVLGFSHIFYHSTAERMRQFDTFTSQVLGTNYYSAQKHYLENTPFIDERIWDNIGFQENVTAPSGFDSARCYTHN